MALRDAKRLLIIHLAGIGDLLMGRPALQSLRAGFPTSRITLLTWARSREIARLIPGVDEYQTLDEGRSWKAVTGNIVTIGRLRRERFDLAVNLYQVHRWIGVVKLAGLLGGIAPARTVGRDTDGRGVCFHVKVSERSTDTLHEVERQLAVAQHLGCPPADAGALSLDGGDRQAVERWLTEQGVRPHDLLIGMSPGGTRVRHRWPWRSFARVAQRLEARRGVRIVLIGSGEEREVAARIADELSHPLVAAGHLSLGQLACLIRRCHLFLTNDSGPMHLAAALHAPLVAVTGTSDPERFGPYPLDRANQVVLHAQGCPRCYRYRCRGHEALERLPIEAVLEAAEAILEGRRPHGLRRIHPRVGVLHVHTLPIISGSGLNTYYSMRGQRDAGYAVELACAPADLGETREFHRSVPSEHGVRNLADLVEQAGMRFRTIRHLRRSIHPWHDLCAVVELWRLMRRERYQIVHTHNSKAGIIGRLAAWLAGVPLRVHTYHSCVFRYHHLRAWQQRLFLWAERIVAPLTTYFIAISEPLRDEFLTARIADPERITVIYSGIDVAAFQQPAATDGLRRSLGLSADDVVIGSVARLDVDKGHQELLEAMAQLAPRFPNLKVVCVGDGPLRARFEEQIRRLQLTGRVILLGDRRDVPQLTHLFDIAVLASHYEGMGRVLLEAQAAGKPVVATKAGGMPDVVNPGQTGYVVPVGDVDALAEVLGRLLGDEALRTRMAQAATQWVSERFSAGRMCEQIQALYGKLLKETGAC